MSLVIPSALRDALAQNRGLTLFCCGNASRGDDGIAPWVAAQLSSTLPPHTELVEDFQWQLEHTLDFKPDHVALFVDAAVNQSAPLCLQPIKPSRQSSHSSHALQPAQLLQVAVQAGIRLPLATWQLGIAAARFELGTTPGEAALSGGERAVRLIEELTQMVGRKAPDQRRQAI